MTSKEKLLTTFAAALVAYLTINLPDKPIPATGADTAVVAPTPKPDTAIPAPPPVVTPAPTSTPTPPPSGTSLSGKQFIGDDFSKYASTADLRARITTNIGGTGTGNLLYTDGQNATMADLDKTVLYDGHATMRYNQPAGSGSTAQLWAAFPKPLAKVWFRARIRFSPGFTTTGTLTNSSNAYKLLGWGWSGYDGSGRLEITNTTQYDSYWGMASRALNGATVGGGNHTSGGNVTTEWTDGAWYTYILLLDHSQPTGVTKVWIGRDGVTPTLRATTTGTMTDSSALPLLNYVFLGMNFNQVRTKAQSLWYGAWEVVDGTQYADPFGVQ